jgi:hypothetical protein
VVAEQKHDAAQESTSGTASNRKKSSEENAASETRTWRRQRSTRATYRDDEDDMMEEQVEVSETLPVEQPRRAKKRLVAYRALKKKQLQELCTKEGLSAVGKEKELSALHESFTNLYNSECDSGHPRSHQALLEVFKRREKARKGEADRLSFSGASGHSHCMEQLKERRKEIGEVATGAGSNGEAAAVAPALTSGNPKFDLELNTNFANMIAIMKARQGIKKAKPSSDSSKEKGEEGGESSEEFCSADSAETSVAVDADTHDSIAHTSDNKVAGADSKATASNGLAMTQSSAKAAASIELSAKLAVEPTAKRKAATTMQRPARSKQRAIAPLPSLDITLFFAMISFL